MKLETINNKLFEVQENKVQATGLWEIALTLLEEILKFMAENLVDQATDPPKLSFKKFRNPIWIFFTLVPFVKRLVSIIKDYYEPVEE